MNPRYGSRKFIVTILAMLIVAGLRLLDVLADESAVKVLITAILGYQAGNVGARLADAKKPEVT